MHQQATQLLGLTSQYGNSLGIHPKGQVSLALGLVNGSVGSGIDDHIRRETLHGLCQAVEITQVTAVVAAFGVKRQHAAQWGQATLQLPANLAIFT